MKRIILPFSIVFFICLLCLPQLTLSTELETLRHVEEWLIDRNYPQAIDALQTFAQQASDNNDYVFFLLGNAFFYQEKYQEAIPWYQKVSTEFPASVWKQKARFKEADCYLKLKQFERAEEIDIRVISEKGSFGAEATRDAASLDLSGRI